VIVLWFIALLGPFLRSLLRGRQASQERNVRTGADRAGLDESAHGVPQLVDPAVLRDEHRHHDALKRNRPRGVGAAGQLKTRGAKQIIERLLVFPPQTAAEF
jgi:hypothetical protein